MNGDEISIFGSEDRQTSVGGGDLMVPLLMDERNIGMRRGGGGGLGGEEEFASEWKEKDGRWSR